MYHLVILYIIFLNNQVNLSYYNIYIHRYIKFISKFPLMVQFFRFEQK